MGETLPARREKGTARSRRGPWPAGPSGVGLPPRECLLAPQAAFGCCCPRGGSGVGDGLAPRGGGGGGPRWWRGWGRVFRSAVVRRPARGGGVSRRPAGAPPPPHACGAFPAAVRPRPVPASRPHPPRLSPRRDGRFAPEAESACASAPRGRVPRRRPAGRRGVCPPLRALPPGRGRAAVRAPELPPRGRWWGPGEIGGARCVRRPFGLRRPRVPRPSPPAPASTAPRPVRPVAAGSCSPPRLTSASPSPPAGGRRRRRRRRLLRLLLLPEGRRVVGGRSVGRGAACARGRGGPGRSAAGLRVSPSRDPPRGLPRSPPSETRPQIRRGDPLNLSILVSGGKETNQDSLSNGE